MEVCEVCGSSEVARCNWVNVNTLHVYKDEEAGTNLEWCMSCRNETTIIDFDDYEEAEGEIEDDGIDDDDEPWVVEANDN